MYYYGRLCVIEGVLIIIKGVIIKGIVCINQVLLIMKIFHYHLGVLALLIVFINVKGAVFIIKGVFIIIKGVFYYYQKQFIIKGVFIIKVVFLLRAFS